MAAGNTAACPRNRRTGFARQGNKGGSGPSWPAVKAEFRRGAVRGGAKSQNDDRSCFVRGNWERLPFLPLNITHVTASVRDRFRKISRARAPAPGASSAKASSAAVVRRQCTKPGCNFVRFIGKLHCNLRRNWRRPLNQPSIRECRPTTRLAIAPRGGAPSSPPARTRPG